MTATGPTPPHRYFDRSLLSMGESRAERIAKIRNYEEWWHKVGKHPSARAVREQNKRQWLDYWTRDSLNRGFRRERRPE